MKLSFSIPGKSSSAKPAARPILAAEDGELEDKRREFVTEFDPSTSRASQKRPSYIIPPKENEWRPHKTMKNIHNLESLGSDKSANDISFEVVEDMVNGGGGNVSYGLTIRQREIDATSDGVSGGTSEKPSTENMLLDKLKFDLHRLPDDQGFKEFEDVPVEGFGAALLAGYGWKEGRGIGKNAKNDVEIKQYHRRTGKEGLGFTDNDTGMVDVKDKQKKNGRDKEKRSDRDSNVDGFGVGVTVRLVSGSRDVVGCKGTVLERVSGDWLRLKLAKTGKEIGVPVSDVAALGSVEEDKCLKKLKELRIRSEERSNSAKSGKRNTEHRRGSDKRDVDRVKLDKERGTQWLMNNIRVRIISKDLKGGRLYLKKAEVVDVVGPYVCDVSMDESKELVQGVDQDLLETALPRSGGSVLVLYGKHKGAYGKLVKRDLDKETGVVQDLDTHEFLNVKLEQIAEYIGDPSDIGY
ncbi:Protein MOS2 [Linum perenne]